MADIFISYSRNDSDFVKEMVSLLVRANKDVWVDWEDIATSAPHWWKEILEGIEGAYNFIFIMSPDSMGSLVCNLELNYAINHNKRIIPIVYKPHDTGQTQEKLQKVSVKDDMVERFGKFEPTEIARQNEQQLGHINWIFYENDITKIIKLLIDATETDLDYVKKHTRYFMRSQEWVNSQHSSDLLLFGKEIEHAETWLEKGKVFEHEHEQNEKTGASVNIVNPIPLENHHNYITVSRTKQKRRTLIARSVQLSVILLIIALIIGGIFAQNIIQETQQQVDELNTTLADVDKQITDSTEQLNNQYIGIAPTINNVEIARGYCGSGILAELVDRDAVIEICDRMVELAPSPHEPFYGDIRGVALAQSDNVTGALDDFKSALGYYEQYAPNCTINIELRKQWIEQLEQGNNPFLTNGAIDMSTAIQDFLNEPSLDECDI